MFNVNVSQLGSVIVKTSEQGGLSNEQIADLIMTQRLSVDDFVKTYKKFKVTDTDIAKFYSYHRVNRQNEPLLSL